MRNQNHVRARLPVTCFIRAMARAAHPLCPVSSERDLKNACSLVPLLPTNHHFSRSRSRSRTPHPLPLPPPPPPLNSTHIMSGKAGGKSGKSSSEDKKSSSRSSKAGLQFPVGRIHRLVSAPSCGLLSVVSGLLTARCPPSLPQLKRGVSVSCRLSSRASPCRPRLASAPLLSPPPLVSLSLAIVADHPDPSE